jgi:hypothetical protein
MLSGERATLEDSLAVVKEKASNLEKVSGHSGNLVSRKVKSVLNKNSGYETLCSISRIMTGESFSTFNTEEEFTCRYLVHLKYSPIVSADVGKSFSK